MRMRWIGLFVVAVVAMSGTANAATYDGYPCSVTYYAWPASGYGSYGFVVANVYVGPNCSGNFVGNAYYCSTGATQAVCAAGAKYTEAGLLALFQALTNAVQTDSRVRLYTDPSCQLPAACGTQVEFRAS